MHIGRVEALERGTHPYFTAAHIADMVADPQPDRGNAALGLAAGILFGLVLGVAALPHTVMVFGPVGVGLLGGVIGKNARRLGRLYHRGRAAISHSGRTR